MSYAVFVIVLILEAAYLAGVGWMGTYLAPTLNEVVKDDSVSKKKFVFVFLPVYFLIIFLWPPVVLYAGFIHLTEC